MCLDLERSGIGRGDSNCWRVLKGAESGEIKVNQFIEAKAAKAKELWAGLYLKGRNKKDLLSSTRNSAQHSAITLWSSGWGEDGGRDSQGVWDGHGHTAGFNMENQQGPAAQLRELSSMSCGSLVGRGVWGRIDLCICVAELLGCPPETIRTLFVPQLNSLFISSSVKRKGKCCELWVTSKPCRGKSTWERLTGGGSVRFRDTNLPNSPLESPWAEGWKTPATVEGDSHLSTELHLK